MIFTIRLLHLSRRHLHKHLCKMDQAYLRHTDGQKFELTFHYKDPNLKINREFNFSREITETVKNFTQRVSANIEKIIKKKTKTESVPISTSLIVNGAAVSNETLTCGEVFSSQAKKDLLLCIGSNSFKVIINSPWVSALSLPSSILAGFPVYPTKFDSVYTDKNLSTFTWFKSNDKIKWEKIGEGFMHFTNNSDIGSFLKIHCLPKNRENEGPTAEAVSPVQVQAGPGFCPFETRHNFTKEKCKNNTFRVVSYNILADLYCDQDFTKEVLHPYCPPYALAIDYRKQLFIKEITGYNGDIICLQEVDRKIYNHDLNPIFSQLNYNSDFCLKREPVAEGLACFFNEEKFEKIQSFRFVLSDEFKSNPLLKDMWSHIEKNQELSQRICDRSTVLQVIALKCLENGHILVVGNTHLYFHPDADHIRLLQGAVIGRLMQQTLEDFKQCGSVILCGDFNSVPDCGIYQLYTTGNVPEDHVDFQSRPEEAVKVALEQTLRLQSACGTPKYTNFTAGFADCLDYIYYESGKFQVEQVVPFPSHDELVQHIALPSIVFPSDHIALVSDLRWLM